MRNLLRPTVAILAAPLFAATLITLFDWLLAGEFPGWVYASAYATFAYLFAALPAIVVMFVLRKMRWRKLRHYLAAGLVVALACTSVFVVSAHSAAIDSLVDWTRYMARYSPFLLIGALTGAFVWFVSESPIPGNGQ